jgi:hypothetical protein
MAGSTNEQLAAEAQGSLALLDAVQEDKLFANLLPHSKGVVLLWGTKIGQCHACRTLVGLRTPRPAPRRRAADFFPAPLLQGWAWVAAGARGS